MQGVYWKYTGRKLIVIIYIFFVHLRILSHNINTSQVKIKDGNNELTVDTSLVEPLAFVKGSQYHFIGEIINQTGVPVVLKARIAGCIDGMDMTLFKQALEIRRRYLKEELVS